MRWFERFFDRLIEKLYCSRCTHLRHRPGKCDYDDGFSRFCRCSGEKKAT